MEQNIDISSLKMIGQGNTAEKGNNNEPTIH